jgi:hypothetical protein
MTESSTMKDILLHQRTGEAGWPPFTDDDGLLKRFPRPVRGRVSLPKEESTPPQPTWLRLQMMPQPRCWRLLTRARRRRREPRSIPEVRPASLRGMGWIDVVVREPAGTPAQLDRSPGMAARIAPMAGSILPGYAWGNPVPAHQWRRRRRR